MLFVYIKDPFHAKINEAIEKFIKKSDACFYMMFHLSQSVVRHFHRRQLKKNKNCGQHYSISKNYAKAIIAMGAIFISHMTIL